MKTFTLRLSEEQLQRYTMAAEHDYQSKSKWMQKILDEAAKEYDFEVKKKPLRGGDCLVCGRRTHEAIGAKFNEVGIMCTKCQREHPDGDLAGMEERVKS